MSIITHSEAENIYRAGGLKDFEKVEGILGLLVIIKGTFVLQPITLDILRIPVFIPEKEYIIF